MHAVIAALAAVILLPAHASVIGTSPADGDTVTAQPMMVSAVMSEEILALEGADSANRLQLTDASGLFYGDGCATVDGDTIAMDATLGAAGEYTLAYQVVSGDGHPVDGTIAFAFEPADGEAGPVGAATAPICGVATPAGAASTATGPSATGAAGPDASAVSESPIEPAEVGTAPAATDEPAAADDGGGFPFLAVGILALLAVLAVVAYTVNRGYRRRRDEL